jgi:ABC-type Mn2+/Zn2+ transport system permease subunit
MRTLSAGFTLALAFAVPTAVEVIGVVWICALLVTPHPVAERLTRRPGAAVACASGRAAPFAWVGLALANCHPHPPGFFIVGLAFVASVAVRIVPSTRTWSGRGLMEQWDISTRSTSPPR